MCPVTPTPPPHPPPPRPIPADPMLGKDTGLRIKPCGARPSGWKEGSDGRVRAPSDVSSGRGGVINAGRRESLEGRGDVSFPCFRVDEVEASPLLSRRQLCLSNHLPADCQGTHAGPASAWEWGHQASVTPGLRRGAAHSGSPFRWGQFAPHKAQERLI